MTDESALEVLVGAYLNQDLFDDYLGVLDAVDDFIQQDPELAATLPAEIDRTLAAFVDENELKTMLGGLGIGFVPGDLGYRGWLRQIADRVRAATGA